MSALSHAAESPEEHIHEGAFGERCPTCDQPIPHEQSKAIRNRIEAQERNRARELEERLDRQKVLLEEKTNAQLAELKTESEARLAQLEQANAVALVAARAEATTAANEATQLRLDDAEEKRKAAEVQLQGLKTNQEADLKLRLAEQRDALEQETLKAVNLANAEAFKEKQKVELKVADLQRQLQRKSTEELGEGAEIDLFEALKEVFPNDEITRVKKGEPGADILHRVRDKRIDCGCIAYDSKNRKAWRNDYVEKLRKDQIAAKADHAVLTSHVFPAGVHQLHLQDGVIVTNPARAVAVAHLLRRQLIQLSSLRLSNDAREEKMVRLYEFIISEQFVQQLARLDSLSNNLLDLDVKEKKAHDVTWNRRGELMRSVQRVQGDISSEIDRIVSQESAETAATG